MSNDLKKCVDNILKVLRTMYCYTFIFSFVMVFNMISSNFKLKEIMDKIENKVLGFIKALLKL